LRASLVKEVLVARIDAWVEDPESDVEYAEELEGRWAVRMRQQARDATTVWFEPGERSLSYEAYVLPVPDGSEAVYHQALVRNHRAWRCFFALDGEGGLVLRGRLPADRVTFEELDRVLGEIYEMVEISFRSLVRLAFGSREKSV
jgi:hypothetical protein